MSSTRGNGKLERERERHFDLATPGRNCRSKETLLCLHYKTAKTIYQFVATISMGQRKLQAV